MSRRFLLALVCLVCLLPPAGAFAVRSGSGETPASVVKKKSSASASKTSKSHAKAAAKASSRKSSSGSKKVSSHRSRTGRPLHSPAPTARSIQLVSAFHASEQLRPMAQQLASTRSAAAYAGVLAYAQSHPGEPAAAAYVALGHAYSLDHRYPEALADFALAKRAGAALDDYADYLGAQAAIQAGRGAEAYTLLDRFADRHPDSIFLAAAPVTLANAHLQQNDARGAVALLEPLAGTPQSNTVDFQFALARAYQLTGQTAKATPLFRAIYTTQPLSYEASQAAAQLNAMGAPLSTTERKTHADALFNARRYAEAGEEYTAIAKSNPQIATADRNALMIYAAVCEFRVKHLSRFAVERLPETSDDTAAAKQYMFAELSRDEHNSSAHDTIIAQMVERYPTSRWLEEALYSGGNMYLLLHDSTQAIYHYTTLVRLFPNSTYAPSAHWRAAWMNYRARNYAEAARLMDEQLVRYPGGLEIPGALYWRGRIYEDEERNFGQAANYYRRVADIYPDYYYAILARQRMSVLGTQPAAVPAPALASA
ncbi:MAG TPA: tetratricopeptide repeat protein, partial [Acidobacteriaceae bacterium]